MAVACTSTSAKVQSAPTTYRFHGHAVSPQARMVCQPEAVNDLAKDLSVKTTTTPAPGWSNGSCTCTYVYPGGARFVLSVRDLASTTAARTYRTDLLRTLGNSSQNHRPGDRAGAFITLGGNAVVQQDKHVLVVDVSGLPATWLTPPSQPW